MAQKKIKNILWSINAAAEFNEIMEFLSENAPSAIEIVGNAILEAVDNLATGYDHNPSDRLRTNNDGTYKSATVLSYRISYQISMTDIHILRIRHTSREPSSY